MLIVKMFVSVMSNMFGIYWESGIQTQETGQEAKLDFLTFLKTHRTVMHVGLCTLVTFYNIVLYC